MTVNYKKQLGNYLRSRENYQVSFLKDLVSFDSRIIDAGRQGQEGEIKKFIAKKLAEIGADEVDVFEPDNDRIKHLPGFNSNHEYAGRPNVVGIFKGSSTNGRSLLLNGHADVVEPGNPDLWTTHPFRCE